MQEYNIKVEKSFFDHGSSVVHHDYHNSQSETDEKLLQELAAISKSLENSEPMVANALKDLHQAIEESNKPKVSSMVAQLSTGFAASLLSTLASGPLLSFLGIK
ncbi:hypothetical protein [Acutalibacter muris]|jgi:uncharacterized membrane protein YjjP (DUF1212 family)|uniref:hypothetical protein n=1 Tax=Acutalibacter muris TaxID=1796620 RepID=UPI0026F4022D|nr:hypothetical protein [Acutalibacter muris]